MSYASEVADPGGWEREAPSCWWCSRFTQHVTARPRPMCGIQRWRAFPTPPWGPQMENEDQPWHFLPSLRLPGSVVSAEAVKIGGGSFHSLRQALGQGGRGLVRWWL